MASNLTDQLHEWRGRTESIDATLRAEADHNDQLRHLSPVTMDALRSIDAFGICTPAELGGSDLHPAAQLDVVAAISTADPSAGWNLMNGCQESAWLATRLPEDTARRIFDPSVTAQHFPSPPVGSRLRVRLGRSTAAGSSMAATPGPRAFTRPTMSWPTASSPALSLNRDSLGRP